MVFIRHRRSENSQFTMKYSQAEVRVPMTIFYSDEQPLSQNSSVKLYFSPAVYVHA